MDRNLLSRVRWGNVAVALIALASLAVLLGSPALGPPDPAVPADVARPVVQTAQPEAPQPPEAVKEGRERKRAAPKRRPAKRQARRRARPRAVAVTALHAPVHAPVRLPPPPSPPASEFGFER